MEQSTLEAIQKAKDDNLIVEICSAGSTRSNKAKNKGAETIIGIWVSRYNPQLRDALIDLYPPLGLLFAQLEGKCEGCFLFLNTATQSIMSMHLGLYNTVNYYLLTDVVEPIERASKDWKSFTKIDTASKLDEFASSLEEFGRYAHRWNVLPSNPEELEILLNQHPKAQTFNLIGEQYSRDDVEDLCDELDGIHYLGNKSLEAIQRWFPKVEWGELNNQDA